MWYKNSVNEPLKNNMGQTMEACHVNPNQDSRMYIVKIGNCTKRGLQHKLIVTIMFTKVDSE